MALASMPPWVEVRISDADAAVGQLEGRDVEPDVGGVALGGDAQAKGAAVRGERRECRAHAREHGRGVVEIGVASVMYTSSAPAEDTLAMLSLVSPASAWSSVSSMRSAPNARLRQKPRRC